MQFQKVVGLERIKKHLIQQVKESKVPHAQLFVNRPGAGGLPLALALAYF